MRFSTSDNPLGLRIGEIVAVKRVCTVAYDGNEKRLFFDDFRRKTTITGSTKRALGTYVPGHSFHLIDAMDVESARLKVTKYVRLYECRTAISDKPLLVHPDDITL